MSPHTEAAALRAAANGDAIAWSSLLKIHGPRMRAFARQFGVSRDVQESACLLAWLRLAQSLHAPPGRLSPWLLEHVRTEILRNAALTPHTLAS